MAITTINEKHSALTLNNWMVVSTPISNDGIGVDDRKQLLRGYPSYDYASVLSGVSSDSQWIHRHRRRGRR